MVQPSDDEDDDDELISEHHSSTEPDEDPEEEEQPNMQGGFCMDDWRKQSRCIYAGCTGQCWSCDTAHEKSRGAKEGVLGTEVDELPARPKTGGEHDGSVQAEVARIEQRLQAPEMPGGPANEVAPLVDPSLVAEAVDCCLDTLVGRVVSSAAAVIDARADAALPLVGCDVVSAAAVDLDNPSTVLLTSGVGDDELLTPLVWTSGVGDDELLTSPCMDQWRRR